MTTPVEEGMFEAIEPYVPTLFILSGLPGSGKSTYALKWVREAPTVRERINYDGLRRELFGDGWVFNFAEEREMKRIADNRAILALNAGKDVVIDNTNLTPKARDHWRRLAGSNVKVVEMEFDTPIGICKTRDSLRPKGERVGWAVIDRMALFNGWVDWSDSDYYPKPLAVFDMDGTLADCEWRKHWIESKIHHAQSCSEESKLLTSLVGKEFQQFNTCPECGRRPKKDWDSFFKDVAKDPPCGPIVALAKLLYQNGYGIIIVSGRPMDKCGMATEEWLREHLSTVPVKHLFMRNSNDKRPDYEVKREIAELLPKDKIHYVFDDRDQVVKMWRELGFTCLQVAEGNF